MTYGPLTKNISTWQVEKEIENLQSYLDWGNIMDSINGLVMPGALWIHTQKIKFGWVIFPFLGYMLQHKQYQTLSCGKAS